MILGDRGFLFINSFTAALSQNNLHPHSDVMIAAA